MKVQKPFAVYDGEELILGVEEAVFLKGAFLLYSIPLLSMFVGGLLGMVWLEDQEWLSILMGLAGLGLGFVWLFLKGKSLQFSRLFQPIVRRARESD